jgi:selenide,water dikinase
VLQPLREKFAPADYPQLLIGLAAADDAAVYQLDKERAIVATTDFFPPVVDDPYDFGAIAAANALSDIYAMGGRPLFALNLVAYPAGLGLDYLREILRGSADVMAEAGAVVAGGHSVTDREPKFGLAVTGLVNLADLKTKGGGRAGDVLVLTKSLGTGLVTTALKQEIAAPADVQAAVASMRRLNRRAAEAAATAGVRGMTDVTGYGLLGHAHEMAHLSQVDFRVTFRRLAWLPGARSYAEAGAIPGGTANNREFFSPWVTFEDGLGEVEQDMLWTPETSGGLLMTVPPAAVDPLLQALPEAAVIGEVLPGRGRLLILA